MWVGNRVRAKVATTPLTFDHPGQWLLAAWARRDRHGRRVASTPLALHGSHHRFRLPVLIVQLSHTTSILYSAGTRGRWCTSLTVRYLLTYVRCHTRAVLGLLIIILYKLRVCGQVFARCIIICESNSLFSFLLQGVRHS